MAGIALGGWLVARIGTGRALLRTGWTQTIAMGMYLLLALSAGEHHVLYATVTTEAFAQGMADAAFIKIGCVGATISISWKSPFAPE